MEYLLKGHIYIPGKSNLKCCLTSEKINGQRAFWDGGISRGIDAIHVPYANDLGPSTGLWTLNGKIIYAPGWWLEKLPWCFLDGELDSEQGWSTTRSIVSKTVNLDSAAWHQIKYKVFDSPPPEFMFADRKISTLACKMTISKKECLAFFKEQEHKIQYQSGAGMSFVLSYERLQKIVHNNSNLVLLPQLDLRTEAEIFDHLKVIMEKPFAEGLIVRAKYGYWTPERSKDVLKIKPRHDAEGIIVGFNEGKGKLAGMIGSIDVRYNDKVFSLSGFTESERQSISKFTIGSPITFSYRELSTNGTPIEAAYLREAP